MLKCKRIILTAVILTAGLFPSALSLEKEEIEWEEIKGDHFIVYYIRQEKFAKKVLDKAEECYKNVADELGYQRYSNFWTWDNRAHIYIYPNHKSYLTATGRPQWTHGFADYNKRAVISYVWGEDFLDMLLPHELTHLIFRDYVGFKGAVSLWLDEGVAQWMEPAKRAMAKTAVKGLLNEDRLIPLNEMVRLDVRKSNDVELINLFYIEAVSLIGFLIERHGTGNFISFCRQLRDGKSLEDALRFAYPANFRSVDELEKQWKGYIRR